MSSSERVQAGESREDGEEARVSMYTSVQMSERVSVYWMHAGPELHILCSVPLTFHMTWEDVEQSTGSVEVQYK